MSDEELNDVEDELENVNDDVQELEIESDLDESLNYDDYTYEDIDGEKENVLLSKQWYKRIEVDSWKTKMHGATIGIRQKDQYRAQSRQFTASMQVVGDVEFFSYSPEDLNKAPEERGKPEKVKDYKEVLAINQGFWDLKEENSVIKKAAEKYKDTYEPSAWQPFLRRLVIKEFSELKRDAKKKGHAGRWRGTIEESVLMGISMTFGEREPRPFFYINIPGYNYRIALMRTHTFIGDRYMFTIPNPNTGELTTFELRGKRMTPGDDFECFNAETDELIASLDDRKLNIGGKVTITFRDEPEFEQINRSTVLRAVLILFAVLIRYMDDINDKYDKAYEALRKKESYLKDLAKAKKKGDEAKIEETKKKYDEMTRKCKMIKAVIVTNSELTLHYNPRRVRT